MDPGAASPSPGGSFRQALSQAARAIVAAGAAGPSPGGQYRQALSPPTPAGPRFPFVMGLPDSGVAVQLPGLAGEGMPALGSGHLMDTGDLTPSTSGNPFTFGWLGAGAGSISAAAAETAAARLASRLDLSRCGRATTAWPPRRVAGATNAGPMMDAASRILAARSRARNAPAARARGDSLIGRGTASIRAHLRRVRSANSSRFLFNDQLFDRYRQRLAPREGERSDDAVDPGGSTKLGMSERFLTELRNRNPKEVPGDKDWSHLPEKAFDLTPAQIESIYYWEFYVRPKVPQVANVLGLQSEAQRFAEQFFDGTVLEGQGVAARRMQRALNKYRRENIVVDGVVGPNTLAAIKTALDQGRIQDVNDTMVDSRHEGKRQIIRGDYSQLKYWDGWRDRANSFRMKAGAPETPLNVWFRL